MSTIPENDPHEMLTFGPVDEQQAEPIADPEGDAQLREWQEKFSNDKPGDTITFRRLQPFVIHEVGNPFRYGPGGEKIPVPEAYPEVSNNPANPKDMIGSRKVPYSVIPETVMAEVGVAMLEGACKYGRYNFRVAPVRASVYYDALRRHIGGWWEGQDIDPDSLLPHITKGIATLVVLRDAIIQGSFIDDRPPSSKPFFDELNKLAAEIIDRHADKNPRHYTIADTGMKL